MLIFVLSIKTNTMAKVETKYGTVTVRNAMLDGKLIGEIVGLSFDKDDYTKKERVELVEGWVERYCDI